MRSLVWFGLTLFLAVSPAYSPAFAQVSVTTSGFVTTPDGTNLHYLAAAPSESSAAGPSLLFIPGWTMPAWIWEHQIAQFSKSHRVVAIDPRGQGKSDKPNDGYDPATRARDIRAVVETLQLAPVVLVGWSMGVQEVAAYIDQFGTEGVAAVVLVDGIAGGPYDPEVSPRMLQWVASFGRNRRGATEAFVRGMYRRPQSEAYLQRVTEAAFATPTDSALMLFVSAFTSDLRPALAKFDRPTLIVVAWAEGNPFNALYEELHQKISGSRFEKLQGVGHALFVDDAERFNSLLTDFLVAAGASRQPAVFRPAPLP
ncbi:MAG: alpha/beta hydrolase [Acidobacteriia bacterium]|jgi:microsomal epoxide hydrolase|nr:alpha/beta hydrolase [Terriglobia bacterium]